MDSFDTLGGLADYIGKYYSNEYVRKYVLRQSEEDIKIIDQQIQDEGGNEEDGEDDSFGGF